MLIYSLAPRHIRALASACCLTALFSCASPAPQAPTAPLEDIGFGEQTSAIEDALRLARSSVGPLAASYSLEAAELMIAAGSMDDAQQTLQKIENVSVLPAALQVRYAIAIANIALAQDEPAAALQALQSAANTPFGAQDSDIQVSVRDLRAQSYFQDGQYSAALRERVQLTPLLSEAERAQNIDLTWEILASAPEAFINGSGGNADSYELRGWLELARLVRSNQQDFQGQIRAIDQWRNTWAQHSAAARLPAAITMIYEIWERRPQEIALVLPVQEPVGKAISEGFLSAYYDALSRGRDVPRVRIYDTSYNPEPLVLYDQAVADGAELVIGPVLKSAVQRIQRSRRPMPVPTLALNYGEINAPSPFDLYQFGLAPEDEIKQAADTAWQAGHRFAAVLTPSGGDYQRIQDSFVSYWEALGGSVVSIDSYAAARDYSAVIKRLFSIDASEARAARVRSLIPRQNVQFTPRRRQDVDFVFVLANPNEGRQIKPTLAFHFADDVPVYAMPSIYDGGSNTAANRDLNTIIFNDAPWLLEDTDPLKPSVTDTWAAASGPIQRLRAMGVDAYRLYLRMELMRAYPYTRINGATGELRYQANGSSIHRRLRNAVIVDGIAKPL